MYAHIQKNVIGVQFHVFCPQLMAITGILQCIHRLNDAQVLGRDTVLHWMQTAAWCGAICNRLGTNGFPVFKFTVRMAGRLTGGSTRTVERMVLQGWL